MCCEILMCVGAAAATSHCEPGMHTQLAIYSMAFTCLTSNKFRSTRCFFKSRAIFVACNGSKQNKANTSKWCLSEYLSNGV